METVYFQNTLHRRREEFKPIKQGRVGIYSCGPTVYGYAHIGNMRANVFADILCRVMKYAGYRVTHVMNITDVGHLVGDGDDGQDKMELGKKRESMDAWGVAEKYTKAFFDHCRKLNIKCPDITPKATDHISEQIEMIKTLEGKGYTYLTEDGVYFDTKKFAGYGDMAKLDIDGLQSGARIENLDKRNKTDFALWKFSPETKKEKRDMEWDSPWGHGFPGWHIECSAMSMKYLGDHFDIHTGGIDHIPIHHTNEIAQSECCTGHKFVNYWLHNEFLGLGNDMKMSKSKGDVLTVDTLIEKGYDPLTYRYLLLTSHYRNPLKFSWDSLNKARTVHEKLLHHMVLLKKQVKPDKKISISLGHMSGAAQKHLTNFKKALFDDLNTAIAMAELHQMLKNKSISDAEKLALMLEFDTIFDIGLTDAVERDIDIPQNVMDWVEKRDKARSDKNWAESDRLRDLIKSAGFTVKDGRDGAKVQKL
jgi:cysteinyl-tRNA synthetase